MWRVTLATDAFSPLRAFPVSYSRGWLCPSVTSNHLDKSSASCSWCCLVKCPAHFLPSQLSFPWAGTSGQAVCRAPQQQWHARAGGQVFYFAFLSPIWKLPALLTVVRAFCCSAKQTLLLFPIWYRCFCKSVNYSQPVSLLWNTIPPQSEEKCNWSW